MWSFVGNKGNKQWVWLALDINTRQIVGAYIGDLLTQRYRDRSIDGAERLWDSLLCISWLSLNY